MMFRESEDRAPTHSQFALRVAVIGGIALVAFAAIFFRLWFLEVLSGEAYLKEANTNRIRSITIPAPRGEIEDRKGRVLVDNKTALALQVRPQELFRDKHERNRELRKLAGVSGMKVKKIRREIREQSKLMPYSPVTLKQDVDQDLVYALRERQDQFPGVTAEQVYVRDYPDGTLGAHLFGYVSEIGPDQLDEPAYEGLEPGDRIGAAGLEAQYDNVLRGRNGAIRVQVDAFGQPRGKQLSRVEPEPGNSLRLTLDKKVQAAGEGAIQSWGGGKPGAFVAMNARNGAILGMGSYPTYDPKVYTPPVSWKELKGLQKDEAAPLTDRAIQSAYPTGSTFKLITATAALEEGLRTPATTYSDTGTFEYGDRTWTNAGGESYGTINIVQALRYSSDLFFYSIGIDAEQVYDDSGKELIQSWAKKLGFGGLTGIDLPGEGAGLLPTPEWRDELFKQAQDPDSCAGRVADFVNCGETDRGWSVGDNMNLSVGQGDLGATPLQLAVAYATMGNGGDVVRPHLALRAEDPTGATVSEFDPAPRRHVDISSETRDAIMEGLREAANEPGGTSEGVFAGYPIEVAGKTGTAETPQGDQSWYAVLAPASNPRVVVVTTVEQGGFGAETAAPAARDILNAYFGVKPGQIEDVGGTLGR